MEKIKLWFLNRKIIFITILIILLAASLIYYFMFYKQDNTIEIISNNIETNTIVEIKEEIEEKEISYISVDIKGYINKPGVYKIDDSIDYRINDQTCPIMIQRLNTIFQRNPLISMGI